MLVRGGVAGAEDGELAAVEGVGIVEGDVANEEADEDELAAGGGVAEGILHGVLVAGAIEDGGGELWGLVEDRFVGRMDAAGTHMGGGKVAAGFGEIEHFVGDAFEAEKFHDGATDGAGADDEGALACNGLGAVDGVAADAEGFDEGQFFEA